MRDVELNPWGVCGQQQRGHTHPGGTADKSHVTGETTPSTRVGEPQGVHFKYVSFGLGNSASALKAGLAIAEAATDKIPGQGWAADDGEENGDLEAWVLFGWGPPEDPTRYTIQGYYTNERGNTVGAWHN